MAISSTDAQPTSSTVNYNPQWALFDNLVYYEQVVDKQVEGFFYFHDHSLFYTILKNAQLDLTGDTCEIGVLFGKSAIAISNYRHPGEHLYIYDIFEDPTWEQQAHDNIEKYGNIDNVSFYRGDSMKLTPADLNFTQPLKFLHIDGSHEHKAVFKDLENFSVKMHDRGVIVIDDFNDSEFPGVRAGLFEFIFKNPDWVIFAIGANKAYLCKSEHHNHYVLSVLAELDALKTTRNLPYNFNLREVNNHNVLLTASRGHQNAEFVRENLNITLAYTST